MTDPGWLFPFPALPPGKVTDGPVTVVGVPPTVVCVTEDDVVVVVEGTVDVVGICAGGAVVVVGVWTGGGVQPS